MIQGDDIELTDEWFEARQQMTEMNGPEPELLQYLYFGAAAGFVPVMIFASLSGLREMGVPGMLVCAVSAGTGYFIWRNKDRKRYEDTRRLCRELIDKKTSL